MLANGGLAPPPVAAVTANGAAPAAGGISAQTWQTLREALAYAAEGRILSAAALLSPAAAASGLSEAALLAKLEAMAPAAAGAPQPPSGSAAQGTPAVDQAGLRPPQPGEATAPAARGTGAEVPGNGRDSGQRSGRLSVEEVARLLALPTEAAWLREGLRQFHDREGYINARDDDLKVSYRHLKGALLNTQAASTASVSAPVLL